MTTNLQSWLPDGGENLFQRMDRLIGEADAAGMTIIDMAVGQPQGAALPKACAPASEAILSTEMAMHEYQNNGSPGCPDFARRFVEAHLSKPIEAPNVDFLPIPGIKPMLGLVPEACGAVHESFKVATMTNPGYPTPRDKCLDLRLQVQEPPLDGVNQFVVDVNDIDPDVKLLMLNYPHNPSGQIMNPEGWRKICRFCEEKGIRIFNDAAYLALHHLGGAALMHIAPKYSGLSWMEATSASKTIGNGTGWRVGAMVGSSDFIGDLKTVKSNTDSGFTAPQAVGALYAVEHDQKGIRDRVGVYKRRVKVLISVLQQIPMELAVTPQAGFFTLWLAPKRAFGQETPDGEAFNAVMIENAGVAGVPFGHYIRYSVCGNIEAMAPDIERAFKEAEISY